MTLEVSSQLIGSDAVVTATGEIDLTSCAALRANLGELASSAASTVVIDLTHVSFIDSTGLSELVVGADQARSSGRAFAVVAGPQVGELLRITGLATVMAVHRSLEEALHGTTVTHPTDTDLTSAP
jgi:anti-sigma B factor antagonist